MYTEQRKCHTDRPVIQRLVVRNVSEEKRQREAEAETEAAATAFNELDLNKDSMQVVCSQLHKPGHVHRFLKTL